MHLPYFLCYGSGFDQADDDDDDDHHVAGVRLRL
jgi:hypothetical protein